MAVLNEPARQLIESGKLAHCVTINPDGGPQVTCVWVGLDGDDIVMAHLGAWQKVRNLRRDARIALSIEGSGSNPVGMQDYLVVHGRADIIEGGAAELLQRLAFVYVGPGVKFPPMDDPPPGYVVRIRPDRIGGHGPWASGESGGS